MKNKELLEVSLNESLVEWAKKEGVVIGNVRVSLHIHCDVTVPNSFDKRRLSKRTVNTPSRQKITEKDWKNVLGLPLSGIHMAILEAIKARGDLTIHDSDAVDHFDGTAGAATSLNNKFRLLKTKYRFHHKHGKWAHGPFKLIIVEPRKSASAKP